nr:uncharacterized protein I303_06708 [Kwoniella dejecticola CBS 10117]OBR83149.1 hypothetical protein I303_06708 [Kwoniella dejecticola CBS 10117]
MTDIYKQEEELQDMSALSSLTRSTPFDTSYFKKLRSHSHIHSHTSFFSPNTAFTDRAVSSSPITPHIETSLLLPAAPMAASMPPVRLYNHHLNDNDNGEENHNGRVYLGNDNDNDTDNDIDTDHNNDGTDKVPIPWYHLSPLILLRILDALSYSIVFPCIVAYIASLDSASVPRDKIGLYAALAEGSLLAAEALSSPFWAFMADRYGRKPCLIWGFAPVICSVGMTGFGRGVWWIILWRALFGLNPGPVLSRTMFTELSHPTNRSFIFSFWGPLYSLGTVFGTFLGGLLAEPYDKVPWFLGGEAQIWRDWPYALPGVICSVLGILTLIICQIMVTETKPNTSRHLTDNDNDNDNRSLNEDESADLNTNVNSKAWCSKIKRTWEVPNFRFALLCFCATYAYDGFFSVFCYASISQGGWGFSIETIGTVASLSSLVHVIITPFLAPRLQTMLGNKPLFCLAAAIIPFEALLVPAFQYSTAAYGKSAAYVTLGMQVMLKNLHLIAQP